MGLRGIYAERTFWRPGFRISLRLETVEEVIIALSAVKAALEKE